MKSSDFDKLFSHVNSYLNTVAKNEQIEAQFNLFMKSCWENQKLITEIANILSGKGFGADDDDAHCDLKSMVASALSDLSEIKEENNALKAQIRNSKVFEKSISDKRA